MAESKPVSIRIPQELLDQVDAIAYRYYPPRKRGAAANRSQMILDFIAQGVQRELNTVYDEPAKKHPATASASPNDAMYDSSDSQKTVYDNVDDRQFISVYDRAFIEDAVQQQLSSLGIASVIAELRQEISELKKAAASSPNPPDPEVAKAVDSTGPELSTECDRPEQSHSATAEKPAPTQSDRDRPEPAEGDRTPQKQPHPATADTVLQQSDKPGFPEWMTAKQAFEALGGDPGDRDSSVSSVDGSKQIKFSTFKSKTSSELKPFGLELSQDRKRRRQPCYRSLKML